jgi:hypothetical protein
VYELKRESEPNNPESLYLRAFFDAQTLAPIKQVQIRGLDLKTYGIEWQTKVGAADEIWLYNKEDTTNGKVTVMQLPTGGIDGTPSSLTPDWSFTLQDPSGSAKSISLVRADDDLVSWRSTATISGTAQDVTYDVYFSDDDGTIVNEQRFHGSFVDASPEVTTIPLRPNFTTSSGRLKFLINNELAFGIGSPAARILLWSSGSGLLWAGKIEGVNLYPSVGVAALPDFGAFYGQRANGAPLFVSLELFGSSGDFGQEIFAGAIELPLSQQGLFPDAAVRPVDGNENISPTNYEITAQGTLLDFLTGESTVLIFRYLADLTEGELFEMKTDYPSSSRLYDFGAGKDLGVLTSDPESERFIFSEVRYDLGTNPECQILEPRPENPLEITNQLTVEDLADQDVYEVTEEENLSLASVASPDVLAGVTFSTTDTVSLTAFPLDANALCLSGGSGGSGGGGTLPFLFEDATDLGDAWYEDPSFGIVNISEWPWFYSATFGWINGSYELDSADASGTWLYFTHPNLNGWFWASEAYPNWLFGQPDGQANQWWYVTRGGRPGTFTLTGEDGTITISGT